MSATARCAATPILSDLTANYMVVSHLAGQLPPKASSDVIQDTRRAVSATYPWNPAMGKEDFRQSACTARSDGDPPEDAVRYTRGQLPGAKIGVR